MRVFVFIAAIIANGSAHAGTLSLQCVGYADLMLETGQAAAVVADNRGNNADAIVSEKSMVNKRLILDFEMTDGQARIRLPREVRPVLNSGKDGWLPITKLSVTERIIGGEIRMNFLKKTNFEIDRATGVMVTKRGFRANCVSIDLSNRKF